MFCFAAKTEPPARPPPPTFSSAPPQIGPQSVPSSTTYPGTGFPQYFIYLMSHFAYMQTHGFVILRLSSIICSFRSIMFDHVMSYCR